MHISLFLFIFYSCALIILNKTYEHTNYIRPVYPISQEIATILQGGNFVWIHCELYENVWFKKKKRKHEGPLNHSYELATSLAVCNIVTNYHDIMLDVYNFESFDK